MRFIFLIFVLCTCGKASGQLCCLDSREVINTSFGEVVLYQAYKYQGNTKPYYYLPQLLRVSKDKSGISQISLLLTRSETQELTGGILHLLLHWGLTSDEKTELVDSLHTQDSSAVLAGSLWLEESKLPFEIGPVNEEIATALMSSMNSRSHPPTSESSKMALSFRLNARLASQLEKVFTDEENTEAYIRLRYRYQLLHCQGNFASPKSFPLELVSRVSRWPEQLY